MWIIRSSRRSGFGVAKADVRGKGANFFRGGVRVADFGMGQEVGRKSSFRK